MIKSIWLLVSGIATTIAGLVGLSRGLKRHLRSPSKATDSMREKNR